MKFCSTLLALSIASSFASYAEESTDIERITVSSDFRQQELMFIPASATILSDTQIESRQAQHLEDILNVGANINFASGASRGRFIQIRGIGERSQFSEPSNPSVGFLVDDFDFSGIAGVGTLFDVEQVEILRGPQATEFGASAMAGVIKVKTVDAGPEQSGKLSFSLAEQNTWSLGGAYGNAITDNLFYRVAVQQFKSDGFVENTFLNRDDTDNLDEFTSRVKLKYLPTDWLTFDLNYQYFDIDNGYDAFSLENTRESRADEPGFDRQETHALGLKTEINTELTDVFIILSQSDSDMGYSYDEDWTYVGFHPDEYSSVDSYFRERDTDNIDIRLLSNDNSTLFNGTTQWLFGLYSKSMDESLLRQYTYADGDFTSQYQQDNVAVYSQVDTQLTDTLSLRLGLRADRFEIDYRDISGFSQSNDKTLVGGKAVLDYSIDSASVYASVSRGYKAAGFNPDERVSEQRRIYQPEYNWNYEVGVKGNFINYDAFIRMAVFYMDREDTQVNDYDVQTRADGSATFIDIIGNADTGTNWGYELETGWQANDSIYLHANFGWLDATFEDYTLADGSVVDKQDQAQAPNYTFNIGANVQLSEQISWSIDADGKDEYRFSDGHDEKSPSYVLVNTAVRFDVQDWSCSVWVKNVFDRTYYVRGFGGFNNDPREGYATPEPYYQLGDGRQVGISAQYSF
ncbi:MAG: TonB-dependent receptor [Paraglaciecola chathamensis]|uniref:TonB-dependent receptor n=2 Tax=Paraglaciecola chathamensis TaxID=368405 RepID=A0A8H9IGU4_9ALTE|nr:MULTISPECIES: TonB-dependent receptor [Paraglaciecola]GAC05763.1 TonB-dependent receptor [Paraglaciecola agarilytica NO2]GGZ80327.1 TonB-dependent receptor [Paraglaciecola oceanifecundans]